MKTQTNFNVYTIVDSELRFIASFRYWEDTYLFLIENKEKYTRKLYVTLNYN